MSSLIQATRQVLDDGRDYLVALESEAYQTPISLLSGSTLGQHTRHWIEFFQCLLQQSDCGQTIDYDQRKRDQRLEREPKVALSALETIDQQLESIELKRSLQLTTCPDRDPIQLATSLERELWYAVEHAIHHLAIIKIGWNALENLPLLPKDFGLAYSTRKHLANSY